LFAWAAARRLRQPAGLGRRPTYFHLLAQMKVGKAKGLNTIWLLHVAGGPRTPLRQPLCPWATDTPPRDARKAPFIRGPRARASNLARAWVVATSTGQIVFEALFFGYFLLGQQKKVTRPPAETGALPPGKQALTQ
jgi:hypothetical protein